MTNDRTTFSFSVSRELKNRVKSKAATQGMDMSDYVEAGIILVVDKNKKEITSILERAK